jgi:hypothetical protein
MISNPWMSGRYRRQDFEVFHAAPRRWLAYVRSRCVGASEVSQDDAVAIARRYIEDHMHRGHMIGALNAGAEGWVATVDDIVTGRAGRHPTEAAARKAAKDLVDEALLEKVIERVEWPEGRRPLRRVGWTPTVLDGGKP